MRNFFKKAKSILISLQKSRKVLQEHNPFTSQESWKLCKKGSLLWFYRRYQEKLILEWRRLCKSLFWFYCRNQEKNVSRAYFVSISGVEKTLQKWSLFWFYRRNQEKTVSSVEKTLQNGKIKKYCLQSIFHHHLRVEKTLQKAKPFLISLQKSRKLSPESRKLCKKAKCILILLQKSRKLLHKHIPFPSQGSEKLCKTRSLFWFRRRNQEKLSPESRKLCKISE